MTRFSLSRFLLLPIHAQKSKILTLHFTTTARSADKFYLHLQNNPNNIEKTLPTVKAKLDPTCVNDVLQRCLPRQSQLGIRFFIRASRQSQLGIRFFIWAGLQSSYRHSSFMYEKACKLLKIKQNSRIIIDVIEAYKKEECVVSVKTMKVLLNLCKKARLANEALWVLRKLPEFNLRADTVMYNMVIRLFCEKGDMVMADNLMKEMGLIDLYPDMITNVSMIKGFCNVDRLEDACALLKAMRGHGCPPNTVAYSTLLDGIFKLGRMQKALELLGEMEKEGGNWSPNVITYTSVIQRFCERGMVMEGLRVLDRMEAYGCAPSRVTINPLIMGLCLDGNIEEAYKFIDKVVAGGSVSYGDCYSSLVFALVRIKRLNEADKLFRKMLASGMKPDGLVCSVMIKELCLKGQVVDGFYLYEEIEKLGCLSTIDSDIHSILLDGLCQESHSLEASKLARFMLEKRIRLQAPYVDKILKHLKKSRDKDLITHLTRIGGGCYANKKNC
ncbi:pentatricopeptide repeat-containing protein At5g47360-like isoform X1 [Pistacia vera]|uniref:pentatricopeptide repeat-containing protein At5g47360-like isoform X1 n=1 Tax=Pistacia vera TaxID=55513 RepID=UPI0012630B3E|nr:pentatricopeptide repeat-containing protein At5g47360-like isoform X1 [Pistacia vera]